MRDGSGRRASKSNAKSLTTSPKNDAQLDAVARLGGRGARLGELAGDAADLQRRDARAVREHDRHLEDDLQLVADVVGREVGERLGAVARLQQEALALAHARQARLAASAPRPRTRAAACGAARRPRARPPRASGHCGCCAAGERRQLAGSQSKFANGTGALIEVAALEQVRAGRAAAARARISSARRWRISSNWRWACICWVNSVAWIPWNRPSSQPTSWACAIRSSDSLGVSLENVSVHLVELRAQVGGEDLFELVDRPLVDLLQRAAARVVERRAARLVEQRAHHRRDADQLRRPRDLLAVGHVLGRDDPASSTTLGRHRP